MRDAQVNPQWIEFSLSPLFEDYGIPLAIMGVVVVFLASALVIAFIAVLPRVVRLLNVSSNADTGRAPMMADEPLSDETLAVITAAVAAVVSQPHRIVSIGGQKPEDLGWSLEGRIQHHQSHDIP